MKNFKLTPLSNPIAPVSGLSPISAVSNIVSRVVVSIIGDPAP